MKVPVYDLNGNVKGKIELAEAFSEPIRLDLIKKALLIEQLNKRQAYGADILAGKRTSAHYHARRGIRHTMMNREIARMKRIHGGGFLSFRARFVPQAVKGRKAHPPKSEKNWKLKINKKEKLKALKSAIAATLNKDLVVARGHKIDTVKSVPLIIEDKFQSLKRTREVKKVLLTLGLKKELERCEERKQRAGRGKLRGRGYRKKKGPLFIITEDKGIVSAGKNIQGIEIARPKELNISLLAPGVQAGRLTIWTESAVKSIENL